jgi:hypothetical protein
MFNLALCSQFWHTFSTFWQLAPIQDLLLVMSRFKLQRLKTMTWNTTMPHQWPRPLKTLEAFRISVRKVSCKKKWSVGMTEINPLSSPWIYLGRLVPTREWPQSTQLRNTMSLLILTLLPHLVFHLWKKPWLSTLWALNQVVNTILKCPCSYTGILRQLQVLYQHPKEKGARRFLATLKVYKPISNSSSQKMAQHLICFKREFKSNKSNKTFKTN